jgi:hypothetical protein
MNAKGESSDTTGDLRTGRSRSGLGSRRVIYTAFAISAAVHLLFIVVYPSLMHRDIRTEIPFLLPINVENPQGMDVIQVIEVLPEEDPERPDEPEVVESVTDPAVAARLPDLGAVEGPVLVEPGPTAAERLRPNLRDERVWAPIAEERLQLTLEQRLDLDLAARIVQYQDSVMEAIASAGSADDWTFTDAQGRRWGVSSGAIHLGDITITLPNFTFGGSDPMAQREVMRVWEAMQRQASQALVQESWKSRAEAIRARRDRERAVARGDTIGGRR